MQFDYVFAELIIRRRENGSEGGQPHYISPNKTTEYDNIIPPQGDPWWIGTHTFKLEVFNDGDTKVLNVYIKEDSDFILLLNKWEIPLANNQNENYTGFRAWSDTSYFYDLQITPYQ